MMYGTLTKIFSTHSNLRTTAICGRFDKLPSAGSTFEIIGAPISEKASFRLVYTTPIEQTWNVDMNGKQVICFKTENSVYGLSVEGQDDKDGSEPQAH
jgi:hypothetical protein